MNLTFQDKEHYKGLYYTRPVRQVGAATGLRLCTGDLEATGSFSLKEVLDSQGVSALHGKYGLIVQWNGPKSRKFSGRLSLNDFVDTLEFELGLGARFGVSFEQYKAAIDVSGQDTALKKSFQGRTEEYHIGAGVVDATTVLDVRLVLNTDSCNLLGILKQLAELTLQETRQHQRPVIRHQRPVIRLFPAITEDRKSAPFLFEAESVRGGNGQIAGVQFRIHLLLMVTVVLPDINLAVRRFPLPVVFEDAAFLSQYPGHAAMDVGNSGSTVAVQGAQRGRLVQVDKCYRQVNEEDRHKALNLKSVVYYMGMAPENRLSGEQLLFPPVITKAGEDAYAEAARKREQRRLVVSPKRYLERSLRETFDIAGRKVSCHLPLRNLITTILKEAHYDRSHFFHQGLRFGGQPLPSMTLTYPSTFIKPEIQRLETIYLKSIEDVICSCGGNRGPIVRPEMLDEATAASFWFLSRDYFESDGRVGGFQYLYENGANILVMDFGGGTTDVALVRCIARTPTAAADADDAENSHSESTSAAAVKHVVEMEVLGRTGLRRFGGDEITSAVFRVLKATVAEKLGGPKFDADDFDADDFTDWYGKNTQAIDEKITTRTRMVDAGGELTELPNLDVDAKRVRQSLASEFWSWAEQVKQWLSKYMESDDVPKEAIASWPPTPGGGNEDVSLYAILRSDERDDSDYLNMEVNLDDDGDENASHWTESQLPRLMLQRRELVTEQIRPQLDRLLHKTNRMLDQRLEVVRRRNIQNGMSPYTPVELHRVYVVGQAAHFPVLRTRIAEELHIDTVNHEHRAKETNWDAQDDEQVRSLMRIVFDKKELKNSVVKGALLFSSIKHTLTDVDFKRDEHLKDKLPFDIVLDSHAHNNEVVYKEGERFDVFADKERALKNFTPGRSAARVVNLFRRWPGDSDADLELLFRFKLDAELDGPISIRYVDGTDDQKYYGFELLIGTDDKPVMRRGTWETSQEYESPLQRGDL